MDRGDDRHRHFTTAARLLQSEPLSERRRGGTRPGARRSRAGGTRWAWPNGGRSEAEPPDSRAEPARAKRSIRWLVAALLVISLLPSPAGAIEDDPNFGPMVEVERIDVTGNSRTNTTLI